MRGNKVSFIIPVYNAEKYLEECIKSILNQTIQDWELLLINDGSPDKSGYICDEYAKHDSRIRVFHKKNGGVSSARNLALKYVTGAWVSFIDSDDVISSVYIERCLDAITNDDIDIVQTGMARHTSELNKKNGVETTPLNVADYIATNKYKTTVCGGIIRSSIFFENNIEFDETLKLGEDQKCIFSCMALSKKILRVPDKLYYYRPNPSGATSKQMSKDLLLSMHEFYILKNIFPIITNAVDVSMVMMISQMIRNGDISLFSLRDIYIKYNIEPKCILYFCPIRLPKICLKAIIVLAFEYYKLRLFLAHCRKSKEKFFNY